jgi:hypothetical protein
VFRHRLMVVHHGAPAMPNASRADRAVLAELEREHGVRAYTHTRAHTHTHTRAYTHTHTHTHTNGARRGVHGREYPSSTPRVPLEFPSYTGSDAAQSAWEPTTAFCCTRRAACCTASSHVAPRRRMLHRVVACCTALSHASPHFAAGLLPHRTVACRWRCSSVLYCRRRAGAGSGSSPRLTRHGACATAPRVRVRARAFVRVPSCVCLRACAFVRVPSCVCLRACAFVRASAHARKIPLAMNAGRRSRSRSPLLATIDHATLQQSTMQHATV